MKSLRFFSMHEQSSDFKTRLQADLALYGKDNGIEITAQHFDAITAWQEFMRVAIYGGQPDLTELGSTWLPDFAAMNVLRPFRLEEIKRMGGEEAFNAVLWRISKWGGDVWAIPWLVDLSLVCYRRDWFARAGIEEEGAFATAERFEQTLQQLKEAGIALPFVAPMSRSYILIHSLAMWLWAAGTNFVDVPGGTVLLGQPPARAALRAFLRLFRFIPASLRGMTDAEADRKFIEGEAAVVIGGPWVIRGCRQSAVGENLGLAIPLGCPYLGGSVLVVWKGSDYPAEAAALVAHLSGREFQRAFADISPLLPARLDALEAFPLPDPAYYTLVKQALLIGRTTPAIALWGMVEDRLVTALSHTIAAMFDDPQADLDGLIDQYILPVVRRLEISLAHM
jgi:multiple sugar transport system substrate-binding protein